MSPRLQMLVRFLRLGAAGLGTLCALLALTGFASPGRDAGPARTAAVLSKPDFNNDGFADLAVGVPFEDLARGADVGVVNVIYGAAASGSALSGLRTTKNALLTAPTATPCYGFCLPVDSTLTKAGFGTALAWGDFNGDGFSDLAVGAPLANALQQHAGVTFTHSRPGLVAIHFGSATGLAEEAGAILLPPPDKAPEAQFGWALAAADFDNDGKTDLAVGAPGVEGTRPGPILGLPTALGGVGAVFFFRGGSEGLTRSGFWDECGVRVNDACTNDRRGVAEHAGSSLAAGDFNGDGRGDLAVGVPDDTNDRGRVYILYGTRAGLDTVSILTYDESAAGGNSEAGDRFGDALAAGDFGFDGAHDLAIGVPFEDTSAGTDGGKVMILQGRPGTGITTDGRQTWHQDSPDIAGAVENGDRFGAALATGNFDASTGRVGDDLAIGVPLEDLPTSGGRNVVDAGMVNVIYARGGGLASANNQSWHQLVRDFGTGTANAGDRFGWSLTAANYGRHSAADLAISVPREDLFDIRDVGMVHVLYGNQGGLLVTGNQFWHQDVGSIKDTLERDDRFGESLAGSGGLFGLAP